MPRSPFVEEQFCFGVSEMQQRVDQISADRTVPASQERRRYFDRLLTTNHEQLQLFLNSLVHDRDDAEDLCQRTCLILWQKFEEYDHERSFLAWACGVARLETMNYRRAHSGNRLVFQSGVMDLLAESLEEMERGERSHRLAAMRGCLQKFSAKERRFFERIYWESCSCEVIAEELGCTLQTFYNRMYLLRRRLMNCVERQLGKQREE